MAAAARPVSCVTKYGGFEQIEAEGFFRKELLKSGKDLLHGEHLISEEVKEVRDMTKTAIYGKCVREMSVRETPYQIEFQISSDRKLLDARCACVAGRTGQCKHAAALFLYINEERSTSQTDEMQKWRMPSRKRRLLYPKGETIQILFDLPSSQRPTFRQSQDYLTDIAEKMAACGLTDRSLYKSITAEKSSTEDQNSPSKVPDEIVSLLSVELFIACSSLTPNDEEKTFYDNNVACTQEKAIEIYCDTIGQDRNKRWFLHKKYRLSASKAHQISRAKAPNRLKYFIGFQGDHPNLRYGREMEPLAREKYREVTGNEIIECGLFVKSCQPWICSTPDAIVRTSEGELITLEIKCPSSCKGKKISTSYLSNGALKINHPYYCQVQIQMYCANVEKCHFCVYSQEDYIIIEIRRDDYFL